MSATLFNIVFISRCRSTHHKLAMDALRHVRGLEAERWRNLFLKYHESYLEGSKAPDDVFKDFKNHVLHVGDNYWGGAIKAVLTWYDRTVHAFRTGDWEEGIYSAGVLSHYYTDPIQPFHTAQSEAEGKVHRAAEWSMCKCYEEFQNILEHDLGGYPQVELPGSEAWLADHVRAGAERAHPHYDVCIDHYDLTRGIKDPPAGLDQEIKDRIAGLVGYATVGFARILERAFDESLQEPPVVELSLATVLAAMKMPINYVARQIKDLQERALVTAIYREVQETGKAIHSLPEDDRMIRRLHAQEVRRVSVAELDAEPARTAGTAYGTGAGRRQRHNDPITTKARGTRMTFRRGVPARALPAAAQPALTQPAHTQPAAMATVSIPESTGFRKALPAESQKAAPAESAARETGFQAQRREPATPAPRRMSGSPGTPPRPAVRPSPSDSGDLVLPSDAYEAEPLNETPLSIVPESRISDLDAALRTSPPATPRVALPALHTETYDDEPSSAAGAFPLVSEPRRPHFSGRNLPPVLPRSADLEERPVRITKEDVSAREDFAVPVPQIVHEEAAIVSFQPGPVNRQPQRAWRYLLDRSHAVEAAPSIGGKTADRLRSIGVRTVADLLALNPEEAAGKLQQRWITPQLLQEWQTQARLVCCVPELRGHDAQILVGCGITEPARLAAYRPADLFAKVQPFCQSPAGERILRSGKAPDLAEVTQWIELAGKSRELSAA